MKKLLQKAVKEELDKQAASNLLLCTYRCRTFWKYVVSQPTISKLWLEDVVPMRHTCQVMYELSVLQTESVADPDFTFKARPSTTNLKSTH